MAEEIAAPDVEAVPKEKGEFFTHMEAACSSVVDQWSSLIPREFWSHGRNAQREFLYAVRALVDGAIDFVDVDGETGDGEEAPRTAAKRSAKKVKVEVE